MSNEFEVAAWLADYPQILSLAIEINNAKSVPVTNKEKQQGFQPQGLQSQSLQSPHNQVSQVEITQVMQ